MKSARDIMRKDKGLNGDLDRLPMLTWVMFLKFLDDLERVVEEEAAIARRRYTPAIAPPYRWRDWAADEGGITGDELLAFINQDEAMRPDGTRGEGLFHYLRSLQGADGGDRRDVVATVFRGVTNRMLSGYLLRDVINKIDGIQFTSSAEIHTLGALYESMLREMRDAAGDSGEFYTPRPLVRFMVEFIDPHLGETVLDPACGTAGFLVESFLHLERQSETVQDRRRLQHGSLIGAEAKPLPYLLAQMNLLLHGLESPEIHPGNSLEVRVTEIGDRDRVDVILTNPPFGGEEERGILSNFPADKQTAETALLFLQLIMRKLRRTPNPGRAAVVVPNTTLFAPGVAARVREELCRDFNLHSIVRLPKGVFLPYTDIETNLLFFDRSKNSDGRVLYYTLPVPDGRKQYTRTRPLRFEELQECLDLLRTRSDKSPNAWFVGIDDILDDPRLSLDRHNPKSVRTSGEDPSIVAGKLVNSIGELASGLAAAGSAIDRLKELASTERHWRPLRLSQVLRRSKNVCIVEDDRSYKRLRIQVKGRGVLLRDEVDGSEIGTKRQFSVEAGQFLLSKIDARNGAFGLVPEEADGAIITGNFWAYDVDETVVVARLLHYLTRSDAFMEFCAVSSPGATNRRYLQEDLFLAQTLRVPDAIGDQLALCEALDVIGTIAHVQERDLAGLAKRAPVLLQSALHLIFGGPERRVDDVEEESSEEMELEGV